MLSLLLADIAPDPDSGGGSNLGVVAVVVAIVAAAAVIYLAWRSCRSKP